MTTFLIVLLVLSLIVMARMAYAIGKLVGQVEGLKSELTATHKQLMDFHDIIEQMLNGGGPRGADDLDPMEIN